jgi:serralysin
MGVWSPGPGATTSNDTFTGDGTNESANGQLGDDALIGNGGVDTLTGGGGADILINDGFGNSGAINSIENAGGSALDDQITGSGVANILNGFAGNDILNGGEDADTVDGSNGNDTVNGGLGADTLYGGAGADAFVFSTTLGGGNVDSIVGFSVVDDIIHPDVSIFTGIGLGALAANAFVIGAAALDADDRIIPARSFTTPTGMAQVRRCSSRPWRRASAASPAPTSSASRAVRKRIGVRGGAKAAPPR